MPESPCFVLNACNGSFPTTDKYEPRWRTHKLLSYLPALQAGSDTLTAIAVLVVALGFVGLAILILFSKKKI